MARKTPWALALGLTLAACSGRADSAGSTEKAYPLPAVASEGELVAQVGPVKLTNKELEKRIQSQSPFLRVQLKDVEQKKKFVENEVRLELLAQEGWRRGLQNDPRIQAELKRLIVQRVMNDELERMSKELSVSESEIAGSYQERQDEFVKAPTIRLSQIVRYAESPAQRQQAKQMLNALMAKLVAAQKKNEANAFAEEAKNSSQDEMSKNGGGDLQFLAKDKLAERYGDAVAAQLFDKLEVGEMVVAEAENAVVLFKKTGARRGVSRSLETVTPQLRGQLLGDKRTHAFEAYVERLQKERGVELRYDQIPNLEVRLDVPTPTGKDLPAPDDD